MRIRKAWLVFPATALAAAGAAALDGAGPPAFVSYPILIHVGEAGADHGHFAMGPGESMVPTPLVRSAGSTAFAPSKPGGGTLGVGSDRDVSLASDSYQGETGAVSAGSLLVAGSNSIYPGNCSASAAPLAFGDCAPRAYVATDGVGLSWTRSALPRTWNGTSFGIGFDPSLDVDKNNTFYFTYGVAPLSGSYPNAIVMVKSTDGVHWTQTTPVTFNKHAAFDDKYYMAIDRSSSAFANRIYVGWDRNSGNNQTLYVAYSSNGGTSWNGPVKVNDGTTKFERVIGAYPAVDNRNGTVYMSWHDYAKNVIFVDKSTTGGASWGADVGVATTHAGFGQDIGCVGGRSQGPAHALKVGTTGTLYVAYADPVAGRGFDVLLTKSTDGGAHWSTPVSLNDDATANDQFQPTLSVQPNGSGGDTVTVTYYDRRDDPNNCLAYVYATQSTDSGATWSANVRQTSAQSNFDGNPNGPGDYSSSTPYGGAVYPFFADHRSADFDVWSVNVK